MKSLTSLKIPPDLIVQCPPANSLSVNLTCWLRLALAEVCGFLAWLSQCRQERQRRPVEQGGWGGKESGCLQAWSGRQSRWLLGGAWRRHSLGGIPRGLSPTLLPSTATLPDPVSLFPSPGPARAQIAAPLPSPRSPLGRLFTSLAGEGGGA